MPRLLQNLVACCGDFHDWYEIAYISKEVEDDEAGWGSRGIPKKPKKRAITILLLQQPHLLLS
ncbi:MAG: hypothetical protein B6241_12090 [Spirochaetaceae bacterium 4572_59]|nr:MAG: hypothetical protein B6241_12090 [Spirochaetaceae bacterium 4572_59]